MNTFLHHEEIQVFLKQVCQHIKAKEVHKAVRMELESHLQDLIEEKLQVGIELDTAVRESIRQMGTAELIGQQFHLAHRPRVDWGLLAIVVLFMTIGLVAIFATQAAIPKRLGLASIGMHQAVFFGIGGCSMLLIGFSNYSKLARYSWGLYVVTIALLINALVTGHAIGGLRGYIDWGSFQMNISAISPYLLLIALAGIWQPSSQRIDSNQSFVQGLIRWIWTNVGIVWLPVLLILCTHSVVNFVLFFIGSLVLLLVLRKKRIVLVTHLSLFAAACCIFVLKLYQARRLFAFINPNEDRQGLNFMVTQAKNAIQSAGWLGHGYGAPLHTLPNLQSEMMFPFLIHCFGWGAGIVMVMLILVFVQHSVRASKKVRDPYGKALVCSLLTLLATQYVWSILMSLGLAPLSSFQLPFISFSGSVVLFQFMAIGLMLSVYRRKALAWPPVSL